MNTRAERRWTLAADYQKRGMDRRSRSYRMLPEQRPNKSPALSAGLSVPELVSAFQPRWNCSIALSRQLSRWLCSCCLAQSRIAWRQAFSLGSRAAVRCGCDLLACLAGLLDFSLEAFLPA